MSVRVFDVKRTPCLHESRRIYCASSPSRQRVFRPELVAVPRRWSSAIDMTKNVIGLYQGPSHRKFRLSIAWASVGDVIGTACRLV